MAKPIKGQILSEDKKVGKLPIILGLSLSLIGSGAFGQSEVKTDLKNGSSKSAIKGKKPKAKTVQSKKEKDRSLRHEVSVALDYNISNGTAEPAGQAASEITENELKLNLSYGYLIPRNNLEPIIEIEYNSFTSKIDDYSGTDTTTKIGLGLLVNLPIAEDKSSYGTFENSKFIPFIGFLVTNNITNIENGQTSSSKVDDSQMITKLTFGNRYKLVDHVTVNSYIRLSYENSDTGATDTSEGGAKTSKLKVEVRLLSLSLLL